VLDTAYWEQRYASDDAQWDLGACSTPLRTYFDQLTRKDLRILIPGAGRAHEAEYLHRHGFTQVYVLDLTGAPFKDLLHRYPEFPGDQLLTGDFFLHRGAYDLIIEQTFFCALDPSLRPAYARHMHELLVPGGKLVGVLFDVVPPGDGPPFGGTKAEYEALFSAHFSEVSLERCYDSIAPRAGRELWLRALRNAPTSGRP